MTGLYLGLVLAVWTWLCLTLADRFSQSMARIALRRWVKYLLFIGLLPLPLADEIYSWSAFTRLCQSQAKLVLLDQQLAGKTIWYTGMRSLPRTIGLLPGLEKQWTYVVAESEAPAFRYSTFHVRGGWLMRMLGISESSSPLLLESYCTSVDAAELRRSLEVTIVDKPVQ